MESISFNSRLVIVDDFGFDARASSVLTDVDFLTLLPAYSLSELTSALRISQDLVGNGCKEFCCVGPYADKLHEEIDFMLEDQDRLDVVTTSFESEKEACEYFIFGADAGEANVLLGLVTEHSVLEKELRKAVLLSTLSVPNQS
ncbi:hypothetical protein [Pseudoxanthomonas sacheonensis]|uniref:Uncharacterized protein n=1 Tax=Pseudoxanthomonas sacheonensis TaxID=443615 RepID=A0ABU1RTU4_9GAMM|nr:hypothetical protein [Pseudoxanthomonas sacheonensis]MDR6842184.1 hypothetical protein [Pseudoxanthomonas sacheonensis]